jgi:hypothetical protein
MIGKIFSIPIQSETGDNFDHLHLVVATAKLNHLVIPGFGAGGHNLEKALTQFEKDGVLRHQCSIELDNSKHVEFISKKTGKQGVWFVGRHRVLSNMEIRRHAQDGYMKAEGMNLILNCVLEWNKVRPDRTTPNLIESVKAVIAQIEAGSYPYP